MSHTAKETSARLVWVKGEWTAQVTNKKWNTRATVPREKADKVAHVRQGITGASEVVRAPPRSSVGGGWNAGQAAF